MKRILIDGRFIGVGDSMTRYCMEIVKGILELDLENKYILLIRPQGKLLADSLKLKAQNLKVEVLDIPHYSLREQTELLKYLNKEKYDLVHFIQFNHPVRYKGKFVVTIHDLTLLGHLHREAIHKRLAFGAVMKSAVRNSAEIITISETSKKDIIEYYGVRPEKIAVTHLAVDSKYNPKIKIQKPKIEEFEHKYHIAGDYFLYTGMWKKHKNLLRMLQAFEKIKSEALNSKSETNLNNQTSNIQLVLAGKIDKEEPEVIDLIKQINQKVKTQNPKNIPIITTGFIEEKELPIAYAGALAYIIPSLSEGFGLPPLEAMACGTSVLSSNVSAMPEILGQAPLYFDPYDIDDMAEKMRLVASDGQLRENLSHKGLEQAKKYDWADTAKKTLDVYKQILFEM